jgi:hypothetical protein
MNGSETVFEIAMACMPPIDKKLLLSDIVTNHSDFALSLPDTKPQAFNLRIHLKLYDIFKRLACQAVQ